jgi:hypothetical protein
MDPERVRPTRKVAWYITVPTGTAKMEIPDKPQRLKVYSNCIAVTGVIVDATAPQSTHRTDGVRKEGDGDTHGWLKLDPVFKALLKSQETTMILTAAFVTAFLSVPPAPALRVQPDSACLHAAGQETQAQRLRRMAALMATRLVSSAEATYAAGGAAYATREQLAGFIDAKYNPVAAEIVPGFTLTLDTTPKGYWFSVTDTTDPCGYRLISNQDGVIFTAQPIR